MGKRNGEQAPTERALSDAEYHDRSFRRIRNLLLEADGTSEARSRSYQFGSEEGAYQRQRMVIPGLKQNVSDSYSELR